MGNQQRRRSWSDGSMWAARTTQSVVSTLSAPTQECSGALGCRDKASEQAWSFAIPLEIIYTTPLSNWNPYGLEEKSMTGTDKPDSNGRNGACTPGREFNGINRGNFFQTP